jgi:hypothetical protein
MPRLSIRIDHRSDVANRRTEKGHHMRATIVAAGLIWLASVWVSVMPQVAAQPAACGSNPNMTTAFVDYSYWKHDDGVWVTCVPFTNVRHNCYAPGGGANGPKLYPAGQGPAPECRSIYNSPGSP